MAIERPPRRGAATSSRSAKAARAAGRASRKAPLKRPAARPVLARALRPCPEDASLVLVDPRSVGVNPGLLRDYASAMRRAARRGVMPGCASVVLRRGELVHAQGFGYADLEAKRPFRLDTICRLYCMTKTYIAVVFMSLVEEGRVSLQDPVSKYIPAFADVQVVAKRQVAGGGSSSSSGPRLVKPRTPMRLKHLLNHTSGLSYGAGFGSKPSGATEETYAPLNAAVERGDVKSLQDFVERLAKMPLRFQPGEAYEYGLSTDVLGRVVEVVVGKGLDECLRERLFEPLNMEDTGFFVPDAKLHRLAACYGSADTWRNLYGKSGKARPKARNGMVRIDGASPEESRWREGRESKILSGGGFVGHNQGGLVSTVADTVRFVRMLIRRGLGWNGRRILKEETLAAMEEDQLDPAFTQQERQCLFGQLGGFSGEEFGWGGAACTYWSLDRKEDYGIVWFTQHVDMPEWEEQTEVDPAKADIWSVLNKAMHSRSRDAGGGKATASPAQKRKLTSPPSSGGRKRARVVLSSGGSAKKLQASSTRAPLAARAGG